MFLFLALLAAAGDSSSLMQRGVSRQLAELRSRQIDSVRYDLRLDVTRRDTAVGHATVRFRRVRGGDVVLDFRGLSLGGATANGRPVAGLVANGAHVRVPAAALTSGENALDFDFKAAIAPSGASIIRFHDPADGADYLYTLLVPADANALFPCFDQPDLKARVTLTLTTPHGWTAIGNGARTGVDSSGSSTVHRFRESEPISTYLIAFAVGPWTAIPASTGRPMTLYVRASRAAEVEGDSLIAINQRAVDWLERYFDRPFPFQKFDFVLAPAFPFGGMEHPGAVFYNEESFIYRERPTLVQRLNRQATIYHEVAHQWFGDLVTMRWFDDLWLKEGFATYMAAKMQDALEPSSNAWKTFYLRNKPLAYDVDASLGTTPIYQPLANLDQAKSNYGAIVYNKAPGVIKQLNYLVGDSAFQGGVRTFLREHAYANATWRDLLGAIGRSSGQSLDLWGAQYIVRAGLPVIEQRRENGAITLVQRPAQRLPGSGVWPMRIEMLFAYGPSYRQPYRGPDPPNAEPDTAETFRVPLTIVRRRTTVLEQRPGRPLRFVFANSRDYGYGLTSLDSASLAYLEQHIGSVDDAFLRAMLWGSMWDAVRDAKFDPARWTAMALRELPNERDEQIAADVVGHTVRAVQAYLSPTALDSLRPRVEAMLLSTASDSAHSYGIRKASLDALITIVRAPTILASLDAALDSESVAGLPLRAPTRWNIVTRLIAGAHPDAARRLADETRRDSTSEGKRRAFAAGAASPDAATKAAYFHRYFADRELNEDWVTASLRVFNDPAQTSLTAHYLVPALDTLRWVQRNRRIFFLGAWLNAFLDGQRSSAALADVDRFLATHRSLPLDLRQKILQNTDELRRTVAIRRRFARSTGVVEAPAFAPSLSPLMVPGRRPSPS